MKNIVITGGAGFLGQRLAKTLLAKRQDVHLTLRFASPPSGTPNLFPSCGGRGTNRQAG